tara:strand:- start:393 stop:503 length:111 start_codon:yes stop_codon:yes gene_type:complete
MGEEKERLLGEDIQLHLGEFLLRAIELEKKDVIVIV